MKQIVWSKTDETPYLASLSLLPIVRKFLSSAQINVKEVDISLAGRILAAFDLASDGLAEIAKILNDPQANIIKLPNISASVAQLNAAIAELKKLGFDLPDFVENPKNEAEKIAKEKYAKILGSAVNPVLRQGNSDRRCVAAVKEYARSHPHYMGEWSMDNSCEIASMQSGDFYANERSFVAQKDTNLSIKFSSNGKTTTLKNNIAVRDGDIVDATFMDVGALDAFLLEQIADAKAKNLLFSLHLKATMLKVSDPVIFGHAFRAYFSELFKKFGDELAALGVNENNGLKELLLKIQNSPKKEQILATIEQIYASNADVAMVDVKSGVDNFGVPSDVIIDASIPALLRYSGKMSDKNGVWRECKVVVPDRTYASVYASALENFKTHGKLDVSTLGSVSNVGLMAQKAQEYGSSDKTFIASEDGEFVLEGDGEIFRFCVKNGDIFRVMITSDEAVQSWLDLALRRAEISGEKLIFWLDDNRAHDKNLLEKFYARKGEFDSFEYEILDYYAACDRSLEMIRSGKNVIGVTGNVLRDYLTDLFPILELGTSAKMLSVVPLLSGGAIFETGAGGTAPRLAMTLSDENHLGWDSLGEFLALIASLEFIGTNEALVLSRALNEAVSCYLNEDKSPKMEFCEADTRISHYYIALYWSRALADSELSVHFSEIYKNLKANEGKILSEFMQKKALSGTFDGWYVPNATELMRASKTLNQIIG